MRRSFVALVVALGSAALVATADTPQSVGARTAAARSAGWKPAYAVSVDPAVAAFSPDGALVAVDHDGTAEIWDVASWRRVLVLRGPSGSSAYAHFGPDGRKIVSFGLGPTDPRIWDTATGRALHLLRGHTGGRGVEGHSGWTSDAVFSPDGTRIITAGWDGTARIWDATNGRSLHVLRGHADVVATAVFSPDGKRIATAGWDGSPRVWDARTGRSLHVLRGGRAAYFSPDGNWLLTLNRTATTIWDPMSGRRLRALQGRAPTMSPDQKLIPLVRNGQTRMLDLASGRTLRVFRGEALGFSPLAKRIATAGWDKQHYSTVWIWDAANGHLLQTLRGHSRYEAVETAVFSPNGKLLLTEANRIDEVRIWDAASGRIVKSFD